jgi:hypothetical protein
MKGNMPKFKENINKRDKITVVKFNIWKKMNYSEAKNVEEGDSNDSCISDDQTNITCEVKQISKEMLGQKFH